MAKKQWHDIWIWKNGMEKPEKVARVKSEGLANRVSGNLSDLYDFVGPEDYVTRQQENREFYAALRNNKVEEK